MKENNTIKFLQVIFTRDDAPEQYEKPAKNGETAIPAAFLLTKLDPLDSASADKVHNYWLGTESGGFAKMVEVRMISPNEYQRVINRVAHLMVEHGVVADLGIAFERAQDEVEHTQKLAERTVGTLLVIERTMTPHGVSETFKTVPRT